MLNNHDGWFVGSLYVVGLYRVLQELDTVYHTVNGERFNGLNFCGALRLKLLNNAIIRSMYNINKYSRKNFCATLENHEKPESFAQQIFSRYFIIGDSRTHQQLTVNDDCMMLCPLHCMIYCMVEVVHKLYIAEIIHY